MLIDNLYKGILLEPIKKGANILYIVSGYATATFARRHLIDSLALYNNIKIKLIIGMKNIKLDHDAFLKLRKMFPEKFECFYYNGTPKVHSKIYGWFNDNNPIVGFSGSSNYSQPGFFNNEQQNQMNYDNAVDIKNYFNDKLLNSISVNDYEIKEEDKPNPNYIAGSIQNGTIEWIENNKSVRISLLSKNGTLPKRSGLNWGQRPEFNREPNQAYLSIRLDARKEGFLPEKASTFTLLTDDGNTMDCTVQQEGRKAISTTDNNSELGLYFRKRLGVKSGKMIFEKDLHNYGRSDFLLKKLDNETFMLDFSKSIKISKM